MNFQLKSDPVMCVAGPSQSRKTEFVLRLLESKEELFRNPSNNVLWCSGIHNPNLQAQLQSKGYKAHRGLPTEADIEPNSICGEIQKNMYTLRRFLSPESRFTKSFENW